MSYPSVVVPRTSVTKQVSFRIPVVSMTSKNYRKNRPQEISQWFNKFPYLLTLFRYFDIVEFSYCLSALYLTTLSIPKTAMSKSKFT
jgi:hypothetical protein